MFFQTTWPTLEINNNGSLLQLGQTVLCSCRQIIDTSLWVTTIKMIFFSLLDYLFINFFNICVVKFMEMCFYKLHCWMFSILCTSTVQTFSATPHVFMFYFQGVRLSFNFFWAIVIEAFLRSFQVFLLDNASTPCTWPFSEAFYLLNHLILTYESIKKADNSRRWT